MGLVSPPLRGSQGIFLGVLFGGLSFPEGPLFGVPQEALLAFTRDYLRVTILKRPSAWSSDRVKTRSSPFLAWLRSGAGPI